MSLWLTCSQPLLFSFFQSAPVNCGDRIARRPVSAWTTASATKKPECASAPRDSSELCAPIVSNDASDQGRSDVMRSFTKNCKQCRCHFSKTPWKLTKSIARNVIVFLPVCSDAYLLVVFRALVQCVSWWGVVGAALIVTLATGGLWAWPENRGLLVSTWLYGNSKMRSLTVCVWTVEM